MSAHPTPGAEPLHTWALARATGRVLWLGSDGQGPAALGRAGLAVQHEAGPADASLLARLRADAPDTLVVESPLCEASLEALLRALFEAAPRARVLLETANPVAAPTVLEALGGGEVPPPGLTRAALQRLSARLGARLEDVRPVAAAGARSLLAADAEAALGGLLAQLSPEAAVGRWRAVLAQAAAKAEPAHAPVAGLLSVVLEAGPDARLLDEAVFSLACQEYRPLELVIVEGRVGEAAAQLERYRALEPFELRVVPGTLADGVQQARGQYLALLGPDCVVYPQHYAQCIARLRASDSAWSLGRVRQALVRPGTDTFVLGKAPLPDAPLPHPLTALSEEPALRYGWVVDRARTAAFALVGSAARLQDLPLRLAALFPPALVDGIPSVEVRTSAGAAAALPVAPPALQVLRSLEQLLALERAAPRAPAPHGLRHQLLDQLNARLRAQAPGLHAWLKAWTRRSLRSAAAPAQDSPDLRP